MREQNHIDRMEYFKKRAKSFFSTYENSSGGEDCLEICLIRDGCRAVSQAEKTINRQQAEIERLNDLLKRHKRHTDRIRMINTETAKNIKAEAIKEFEKSVDKIAVKRLKFYLDTNEENGVVYIPKFTIEKILKELKEIAGADNGEE